GNRPSIRERVHWAGIGHSTSQADRRAFGTGGRRARNAGCGSDVCHTDRLAGGNDTPAIIVGHLEADDVGAVIVRREAERRQDTLRKRRIRRIGAVLGYRPRIGERIGRARISHRAGQGNGGSLRARRRSAVNARRGGYVVGGGRVAGITDAAVVVGGGEHHHVSAVGIGGNAKA